MDLFSRLPEEDVRKLHRYISWYGGGDCNCDHGAIAIDQMDHFLRYWGPAKAPFYKMFGEQFIIKQEICFEKPADELDEEMDRAIRRGDVVVQRFSSAYQDMLDDLPITSDERYSLRRFVRDTWMLVENTYDGPPITIKGALTIDGRPLQINTGAKTVKMLGKIATALGLSVSVPKCSGCGHVGYRGYPLTPGDVCPLCGEPIKAYDGYEAFRRAHSLVLNQKKIKGNLCLSIHPLDFITISDNDCGWSSCMSWMEEPGDYRLGTIEMMNSESVIVAYVEAKEDMGICNEDMTWNNKRWRQLVVVTPELILGNKQYPYESDILQGAVLKWVRKLAEQSGFSTYCDETIQLHNKNINTIGDRSVYFNIHFSYMYNDIYDYRLAFIKAGWDEDMYAPNLSGPAVCTSCGDIIPYDDVDPSWTTCRCCNGMWRCDYCGEWHYGEPYCSEDGTQCYCEYCWHHVLQECEVCGDHTNSSHRVFIQLVPNPDAEMACFNWTYTIDMCDYCYENGEYEELFGPIFQARDMYGRERNVVSITTISDEGLRRGSLDSYTIHTLAQIRDAESDEDRANLIRKNLY